MSEGKIQEKLDQVDWDQDGLVPVVVQTMEGEVVTLAYMNREALRLSLQKGQAHYYSRTKGRIRMKGEVSGNVQEVKEIKIDCDEDALLMKVNQKGPACHTGERSCFYRTLGTVERAEGGIDYSLNILKELEKVILDREQEPREDSYTSHLFEEGSSQIDRKFGEEAIEVLVAEGKPNLIREVADLLYHLLVLLRERSVELGEVMGELERRRG